MKKLAAALMMCALANPAHAMNWGTFKDNGCVTYKNGKFRVYSSVLWGIPPGHSWEVACAKMPAKVGGQHFAHPTACVKTSVVDAVGITSAVLGVPGLFFPPAGVAGAVIGASAIAMDKAGIGGLNMWGVFYVQSPKCR